jgi:DNA-binding HxlR family transcriptional regulator
MRIRPRRPFTFHLKVSGKLRYTYQMVTNPTAESFDFCTALTSTQDQMARALLERITGKWSLAVTRVLAEAGAPLRFSRVLERVSGISQKVLTQTLRTLERDGLITRTLYPQVPPRVEYELTALGAGLIAPLASLWRWVAERQTEFDAL